MKLKNLAIIGSSAGGTRILKKIFNDLPNLDACIIIVQHMPKFINESLRSSIQDGTKMDVVLAENGMQLMSHTVYLAPSEFHLEVSENDSIHLYDGEKVNYVCPAVDVTMNSVKKRIGLNLAGIILTGMGRDGAEGIRHMKEQDALTIAQDEVSSVIYGMPKAAAETGSVDLIMNPEEIRKKLIELYDE